MEEKLLKTIAHHIDEHADIDIVTQPYNTITINIYKEKEKLFIKNYFYGEVSIATRDDSLPTFMFRKVGGTLRQKKFKGRILAYEWRLREEELLMQLLQSIRPYLIKQKTETEILIEFLQYKNKRLWDCPSYIKSLERIKSKKESWIGINKPDFSGPFLP